MSEVSRYNVLDDSGLDDLLASIFTIVETYYVRRSKYEDDIRTLVERIDALDSGTTAVYPFEIDETTGNLVLSVSDDAEVTIAIEDGNLVLTSNDTELEQRLAKYSFDVEADGNLYMTVA